MSLNSFVFRLLFRLLMRLGRILFGFWERLLIRIDFHNRLDGRNHRYNSLVCLRLRLGLSVGQLHCALLLKPNKCLGSHSRRQLKRLPCRLIHYNIRLRIGHHWLASECRAQSALDSLLGLGSHRSLGKRGLCLHATLVWLDDSLHLGRMVCLATLRR